jgi:hypothetical protein
VCAHAAFEGIVPILPHSNQKPANTPTSLANPLYPSLTLLPPQIAVEDTLLGITYFPRAGLQQAQFLSCTDPDHFPSSPTKGPASSPPPLQPSPSSRPPARMPKERGKREEEQPGGRRLRREG